MKTEHKTEAFDVTKGENKGSIEDEENPLDRAIRNMDIRFLGGGINRPDNWRDDIDEDI